MYREIVWAPRERFHRGPDGFMFSARLLPGKSKPSRVRIFESKTDPDNPPQMISPHWRGELVRHVDWTFDRNAEGGRITYYSKTRCRFTGRWLMLEYDRCPECGAEVDHAERRSIVICNAGS